MPNDIDEKIISLRVFMPESLRNNFKAVCAKQGKNMSEVVSEFVTNYVANYEENSPKPDKGKGTA